jgi:hypothetical protein
MKKPASKRHCICHPHRLQNGAGPIDSARVYATSAPIKNERQRAFNALIPLDSGIKQEAGK